MGNPDACAMQAEEGWRVFREAWTEQDLDTHLNGDVTLGTFPIVNGEVTSYIVWDVDTLDPTPIAQLVGVLRPPYLVEHTGGRGRHIWQFFSQPVPAADVVEYGQHVLSLAGVEAEVYPKQADRNGGLGNLIRVPFGVHTQTGQRSVMEFGELRRVPFNGLYSRGAQTAHRTGTPERGTEDWIESLYAGHAPDGRNNSLNRLAYWMLARGFPFEVVVQAVLAANATFDEPLSEDELLRTVLRERRA